MFLGSISPKRLLVKKFWLINCLSKNFGVNKYFGPKRFGPKVFLTKMVWSKKKFVPKSLVKIGSVTAEIFLIWTNVARTDVAWTNVTVTVGIY